jgi:proton glutamate symport protein
MLDAHSAPESHARPADRAPRRRWWPPIGVQSLIAVGLGALIGVLAPSVGEHLKLAGDLFLNLVKMVVLPLVFPLIVLGIAQMESVKKVGRMAGKAILYFEIVTTLILLMAVSLAVMFDLGSGASTAGADSGAVSGMDQGVDFTALILHAVPANIFAAFAEGNLLAVIIFAVFLGVALAAVGEPAKPLTDVLQTLATAMFKVVDWVIRLAPLGVLGFISYDVSKYGLSNLGSLLSFVGVVYLGLAIVLLVIFPIIAKIFGIKYVAMLREISDLVGLAFVTRSSEAVLAPLLGRLKKLGVRESTSSFIVPLGYSFNTDGSVLYQAVALVYLSNAYDTGTSIGQLMIMVGVLVIMSKGMAGVASASIVVLIGAASSIGLPAEGVALLLGVDFLVDMARTAVNVVGNSLAASVIDNSERRSEAKASRREDEQTARSSDRIDPESSATSGTPGQSGGNAVVGAGMSTNFAPEESSP